MRSANDLFAKCERVGEDTVRKLLAGKTFCTHDEIPIVEEWLRRKDKERAVASSSKRDVREEETLSIAKEANRIALDAFSFTRRSRRADRIMTITAITIAVIAAREDIIWLISWLLKQIIKSP